MNPSTPQTLDEKVSDILCMFKGGLHHSRYFYKYLRITLTEQSSLRRLTEQELRTVYHYFSSVNRDKDRLAKSVEEHAVPIKVLAKILVEEYECNPIDFQSTVYAVLEKCLWVVFITDEENRRLNQSGYKQIMPVGWNWRADSPFVRYELSGIELPKLDG